MHAIRNASVEALALALALAVTLAAPSTTHAREVRIEPSGFVTVIDNPLMPLVPGTTRIYEGTGGDEGVHIEVLVTCETKSILGVATTVVFDREWIGGVLVERTYDWFAQDTDGNVWYFGEYTEELDEDGNVISTEGSWEAGVDGAEAGIIMLAQPQPGDWYQQEYYEGVAEDRAKILRLDAPLSVPYGDFPDALKTKEWSPLRPGGVEHKSYAEGVGLVLIEGVSGGPTGREELVEVTFEACD